MQAIIPQIRSEYTFPDPKNADDYGLLAWGGDINPDRLLLAYKMGIFPWYNEEDPVLWWSPNPRLVLYPQKVKISKSLRRNLKKFEIRYNTNFKKVVEKCRDVRVDNGEKSWIHDEVIKSYTTLHQRGFAISSESYIDNELVGGVYGVSIGNIFFGESMFQTKSDASKAAFVSLCKKLHLDGCKVIDCQVETKHLVSLGAQLISRDKFLDMIKDNINV